MEGGSVVFPERVEKWHDGGPVCGATMGRLGLACAGNGPVRGRISVTQT
jgi:hypothetical protein